jgi:hypothetical protein
VTVRKRCTRTLAKQALAAPDALATLAGTARGHIKPGFNLARLIQ